MASGWIMCSVMLLAIGIKRPRAHINSLAAIAAIVCSFALAFSKAAAIFRLKGTTIK